VVQYILLFHIDSSLNELLVRYERWWSSYVRCFCITFCKLFDETIVLCVYSSYWNIHQLDKYEVTCKLSDVRSFRELSKGKYVLLNRVCKIREKVIRQV